MDQVDKDEIDSIVYEVHIVDKIDEMDKVNNKLLALYMLLKLISFVI